MKSLILAAFLGVALSTALELAPTQMCLVVGFTAGFGLRHAISVNIATRRHGLARAASGLRLAKTGRGLW